MVEQVKSNFSGHVVVVSTVVEIIKARSRQHLESFALLNDRNLKTTFISWYISTALLIKPSPFDHSSLIKLNNLNITMRITNKTTIILAEKHRRQKCLKTLKFTLTTCLDVFKWKREENFVPLAQTPSKELTRTLIVSTFTWRRLNYLKSNLEIKRSILVKDQNKAQSKQRNDGHQKRGGK